MTDDNLKLREKPDFASRINADSTVQSPSKKYSALPVGQIICTSSPGPVLLKRGVSRSSRTLGAGCGGRFGAKRRMARKRTAKSCGPDAPTLASTRDDAFASCGDGGKRARSPGRARRKPLKPSACGNAGSLGATVVTNSYAIIFIACEAAGAASTWHSPRPLWAKDTWTTRA